MPSATDAVPASATIDLIRATLGDRYSLERELGRGGIFIRFAGRGVKQGSPTATVSRSGARPTVNHAATASAGTRSSNFPDGPARALESWVAELERWRMER